MIDDPIDIVPGVLRLSAVAMRSLSKATGRAMSELMQDDDDETLRLQVQAFAELHRRAVARWPEPLPDPGELWERAGLVELEFRTVAVDPLGDESLTTSPPSAATGG
jgi:hypothetical protein